MRVNIEDVIKKYIRKDRDKYRMLALKVKDVLLSILELESITPHSITYREKDPYKLREKIEREGKNYTIPLEDITDLAGVRVITYFPSDVDKIIEAIEKNFTIDREKSIDKRKTSDPSVFGYASVHLIVEFSPERLKLQEYSIFKGMRCEVQVRTILQHAWAEIEHDIVYKSTEDIPFELRRRFSSLAGMLEIADREFESLRETEQEVRMSIKRKIKKDIIDIPIDFESVRFYLEKYHKEKEIDSNRIRELVKLLAAKGISTVEKFDQILTSELLSKADERVVGMKCTSKYRCMLRYFLAIIYHFDMKEHEIREYTFCPEIEEIFPPLKRIAKRGKRKKSKKK